MFIHRGLADLGSNMYQEKDLTWSISIGGDNSPTSIFSTIECWTVGYNIAFALLILRMA